MKESITIDGIKYAYTKRGKGEPIVMLHGITTNSFVWNDVIKFLENKYSIYAIDLPGCGESDKSVKIDYSIKNQAQLIAKLIKSLNIGKVHVAAHDVGGGIAQIIAVRNPELFIDLTLINTVAYDFWPVQPIIAMRTPIIRQIAIATIETGMLRVIVKRGLYHKDKLTEKLFDNYLEQMNNKEGRKAFLHFARCLNNNDLLEISDELGNIRFPVQIIRGEADVYLSKEISDKLHNNINGSILKTIKTAGHYAMIDEPEIVAKLMTEFMERQNG